MLLQMSGPLRAPLAVEILLLKLSQKLFNNLKLVVQSRTQNFLNDLVQRSLAGWIWLYMGQMVNHAGVRFAFESSNADIGLLLTPIPTQRLRSEDWKEHMTSVR